MASEGQRDQDLCDGFGSPTTVLKLGLQVTWRLKVRGIMISVMDLPVQLACIPTQFDKLFGDSVEVRLPSVMASEGQIREITTIIRQSSWRIYTPNSTTHLAKMRKLGRLKTRRSSKRTKREQFDIIQVQTR
ncbi:hypothetical protein QJS10_CPB14g01103 [Acorus calamus]|uniref:Uncharacterized protein n=1 Tax=Acorus calamus TaxID=4465 RepID=A0AAV9DE56_ACOCL|nr:hypothetical protein QJS10_CPB14g01103 [Acorus calamus]